MSDELSNRPSLDELLSSAAQWENPISYPDKQNRKFVPPKGSPPERLGSPGDFAMSILLLRQQLEPVYSLYKEAVKAGANLEPAKQTMLAEGFGQLFREIYYRKLSALRVEELMDNLFIDQPTLQRLQKGQATYEEAVDIFEPLFFLLDEVSSSGKLQ